MEFNISFKVNESIFLKNPEASELGKRIVKHAIELIYEIGFESLTFKKLASVIGTTEASIYRYFENKHRLLLYIITWYWKYLDFLLEFQLQNVKDKREKLLTVIRLLTHELPAGSGGHSYNKLILNQIVMAESSKVYLIKDVEEINKNEVFQPYKDLCAKIAGLISDYNKQYPYPKSLSSTLIETAHHQQFFSQYLPRLTDIQARKKKEYVSGFLEDFLFRILDKTV